MKRLFVFLLFLFVVSATHSQEIVDSAKISAVKKSYELKGQAWEDWKKIEDSWMKTEYSKILKANKLKMNCNGCSTIYLDVVIQIDTIGKMSFYKLIDSKKCTDKFSKALEIQFMKSFFKMDFPPSLKNNQFQIRLGTGLKC